MLKLPKSKVFILLVILCVFTLWDVLTQETDLQKFNKEYYGRARDQAFNNFLSALCVAAATGVITTWSTKHFLRPRDHYRGALLDIGLCQIILTNGLITLAALQESHKNLKEYNYLKSKIKV